MSVSPSPFTQPQAGLRIKEGAPPIRRPSKEDIETFPSEAQSLIDQNRNQQVSLIKAGSYNIKSLEGKHFLLAGATGPGLGGALATACMELVKDSGSITLLSRDLKKSIGYEMGVAFEKLADKEGMGNRFHWLNGGMALEGDKLDKILSALKEAGADKIIYINGVAAASSGILPGYPPVYVKDVDEEGLFQWELTPLDERGIEATKMVMGTMAINFPKTLESNDIQVEASLFADWRGSIDRISRDPQNVEYGRQGAYSTSLYLPKDIIQMEVSKAYGSGKILIDVFFPVMRTRALGFIPGGNTMGALFQKLMSRSGVPWIEVPELALGALNCIHQALYEGYDNPFPRLDMHEAAFDQWFSEIVQRLNMDESSDFYYKKWVDNI